MSGIENYIYGIVKEMQAVRIARHRSPASVSIHEIKERAGADIKEALNALVNSGDISWYANVNGIPFFEIKSGEGR